MFSKSELSCLDCDHKVKEIKKYQDIQRKSQEMFVDAIQKMPKGDFKGWRN